ncbi:unnamed protein product [Arabidopsis halleri]
MPHAEKNLLFYYYMGKRSRSPSKLSYIIRSTQILDLFLFPHYNKDLYIFPLEFKVRSLKTHKRWFHRFMT